MKLIVAARHDLARQCLVWLGKDLKEWRTVTQASSLHGHSKGTEVIVIDSDVKFDDHRAIEKMLSHYTNVRRIHINSIRSEKGR